MDYYPIRYAQYQGRGHISGLIKLQTDSIWSHTAAILRDGSVVEAWHKGGVDHVHNHGLDLIEYDTISCLSKNHKAGTPVNIFGVQATEAQADIFEAFILSQVGEKYDFWAVFRFLTRKPYNENNKWFCTELVAHGLVLAAIHLQERILCYKMSPQLAGISPLGMPITTVVTI